MQKTIESRLFCIPFRRFDQAEIAQNKRASMITLSF